MARGIIIKVGKRKGREVSQSEGGGEVRLSLQGHLILFLFLYRGNCCFQTISNQELNFIGREGRDEERE